MSGVQIRRCPVSSIARLLVLLPVQQTVYQDRALMPPDELLDLVLCVIVLILVLWED